MKNQDLCLMPKELTAENGAKALLSYQFCEQIEEECQECADEQYSDDCKACEGTGYTNTAVVISWTNIKKIYAMAVKNLAQENSK